MRLHLASVACLLFGFGPGFAASLCTAGETTAFSCPTRQGKVISICASRTDAHYRFGRPGAIELVYPSSGRHDPRLFRHFHYFRAGAEQTSLSFTTAGATYTVFSDADETGDQDAGVTVRTASSTKQVKIACARKPDANWTALEGLVSCSQEDMNACKPP
jgi:hypothetical protein